MIVRARIACWPWQRGTISLSQQSMSKTKARYSLTEKLEYIEHIALRHNSWECLIWPFTLSREGYGVLTKGLMAHRRLCEMVHGPAPGPFYDAAHTCGVRGCMNKHHICWKTKRGNADDRNVHDTHLRGERSPLAKLTNIEADHIRNEIGPERVLAKIYGVSRQTIRRIKTGVSYRTV